MRNNLTSIKRNPANICPIVFGTDGLRGEIGKEITPALALDLGFICGNLLEAEGPILIGRDPRESGSMLSAALIAGLTSAGKDVWELGICPTPAIPFLISELNAAGGLMVTASHNPPKDNGIKVFAENGQKITLAKQILIQERLNNNKLNNEMRNFSGTFGNFYERNDAVKYYQKSLTAGFSKKIFSNTSIVLDLCWGAATRCASEVFKELGAKLTVINSTPNGKLINLNCGSTNLSPLIKTVLDQKADMGFAFDGDSDRIMAIDKKGRIFDGDHILYLLGNFMLENSLLSNKLIVGTIMSNLGLERSWKNKGGSFIRVGVGDQNINLELQRVKGKLGGEPSGHIISSFNNFSGDGILTALIITKICIEKNIKLDEFFDQSFNPFPMKLVNVPIQAKQITNSWDSIEPLKEALIAAEDAIGDDGRILLRASGTQPLIRVMVEAEKPKMVDYWSSKIANLVNYHINVA